MSADLMEMNATRLAVRVFGNLGSGAERKDVVVEIWRLIRGHPTVQQWLNEDKQNLAHRAVELYFANFTIVAKG